MRSSASQDSELYAGEMFVPAGYSPGRSVCARGGRSARREQFFVAALGVRFTPAKRFCWSVLRSITPVMRFCWSVLHSIYACHTFLLECLALVSRLSSVSIGASGVRFTPAKRSCWNVWRSSHACHPFLLERLVFGSRLSLFLCQEKRDGLREVMFLFRVGRDRH